MLPATASPMTPASRWLLYAAVCAALAAIAWAYWPGLAGGFVFDDYANLDALGAYGPLDDWRSFLYYLTSGDADPTGRPVALLTFLIDGQAWPTDPWPFKRTNLVLHLLNTGLLAWTVHRLQTGLRRRQPGFVASAWTPLLAATLWGAHPFFVSTTLYVVQREAMLPMTFVLLALLAWDRAGHRFANDRRIAGWSWAILGMGAATVLAGLSKANGFLAPLLAGLAYLYCLRPAQASPERRHADAAALLCLGVPSALLLAYLMKTGIQLWPLQHINNRDWTLPERLLSQPRALWDYLGHLALPRAGGGGVFVEGFATSRGWLDPLTTLPAALALTATTAAAVAWRRRFPVASFAWIFFLGGHLLESSVIPLEPYFEHRNYLPAMFLGWPLAQALLRPGAYARYRTAFALLLVAALLLLTHQRASLWGNPSLLTALSATHQRDSVRSQVQALHQQIERGRAGPALARIDSLLAEHPHSVDVAANAVGMHCEATGALPAGTLARARAAIANSRRWNYGLYTWLRDAATNAEARKCKGFGLKGLAVLVDAVEANPRSKPPKRRREIWHVRGHMALAAGHPEQALDWFNRALDLHPDPEFALVQAAALGNAGQQALGVRHLAHFDALGASPRPPIRDMAGLHQWVLRHYGYYDDELAYLRERLERDAAAHP